MMPDFDSGTVTSQKAFHGVAPMSAAVGYVRLLEGGSDVAFFWRSYPWDHVPGALMLDESLRCLIAETGRAPVVVTGALGEYRARALLATVARHAREIHLVIPHQDRASTYDVLEACVPAGFTGAVHRATVADVPPN